MKKIPLILTILIFVAVKSQKCNDVTQNITANGHFNFTTTENNFKIFIKDSIESIELRESNSKNNLKIFQQKFPNIYDGKCLKMKSRNSSENESYLCDKKQKESITKEFSKIFGTFSLISIQDYFYIFKYSGFEIGGYFVFNSLDNYSYFFSEKPKFSPDKNIIYSISNSSYDGLNITIVQLDYYRELSYTIQGKFDIISSHLLKYNNTGDYALLLDFNREIEIRNENYDIIGKEKCNSKLRID